MSWVIAHSPHKGADLLCLLMVANHAHADGSGAFPSVPTLAAECRMSARQIVRILRRLETSGALLLARGAGPRGSHLMTVVMDVGAPVVSATPDILSGDKTSGDILTADKSARGGDIAMSPEPSLEPSLSPSSTRKEAPAAPAASPAQLRLRLPKDKTTDAVRAANAVLGKKANQAERAAINEAVPATVQAQQLWESCLRVWRLRYAHNKSLEGPLEWFAAGGPPPKRTNGALNGNGAAYVQPNTQKRNDNPAAALPDWTPEQAAASDGARARVLEEMKARGLAKGAARIGG